MRSIVSLNRFLAIQTNGKRDKVRLYRRSGITFERFDMAGHGNGTYVEIHDITAEVDFVIEILPEDTDPLIDYTHHGLGAAWQVVLRKLPMELRRPGYLRTLRYLSEQVDISRRADYIRNMVTTIVSFNNMNARPIDPPSANNVDTMFGLPYIGAGANSSKIPVG